MNEEENQAFKALNFYNSEDYGTEELKKYIKIIVNLVEKQQKEIEDLKNDHIDFWINTKEVEDMVRGKFISKDKIKEKIENKISICKCEKFEADWGMLDEHYKYWDCFQDFLEKLLEELLGE